MGVELRCTDPNLFVDRLRDKKVVQVDRGLGFAHIFSSSVGREIGTVFLIAKENEGVGGGWSLVGESDFFTIDGGTIELTDELAGVLISAT